jgi:hypothetical protein
MNTDRRAFLKQVSSTTAAVVGASVLANRAVTSGVAQETVVTGAKPIRKSYVTRRCVLELEGRLCGWLSFAEGGSATADVATTPGAGGSRRKSLGPVRYEDIVLFCNPGMSQPFYDWIKTLLAGKPTRKSGAIVYLNSAGAEVSRLDFTNALIIEVGFPWLDTASIDAAAMTVRLVPESTRRHRDRAGRMFTLEADSAPEWRMSDFRLDIDGLTETTSRALQVEGVVAGFGIALDPATPTTESDRRQAGFDVSDLVMTFPSSGAQPIEVWFEDFVIKGNRGDDRKKNGTLHFLAPNKEDIHFKLSFERLGIYRLEPVLVDTGDRFIHLLQARMFCEGIRFDHHATRA